MPNSARSIHTGVNALHTANVFSHVKKRQVAMFLKASKSCQTEAQTEAHLLRVVCCYMH